MSSIEYLSDIITDSSQPITSRRAAVIELAEIGSVEVLPILTQALSDNAAGVRREAATALSKYNGDEVIEILLNVLRVEENDLTLWTVIEVLGLKGTETTLPHLSEVLKTSISPLTRRELQKSIKLIEDRIHSSNISDQRYIENNEDEESNNNDSFQQSDEEIKNGEFDSVDNEQNDVDITTDLFDEKNENGTQDIETDINNLEESDNLNDTDHDSIIDISIDNEDDIRIEEPYSEVVIETDSPDSDDGHLEAISESKQPSDTKQKHFNKNSATPSLPVLVPNTSVVIYERREHAYQPSIFDLVLRPNEYLTKRWVSRTRLYFVVFCLLITSTIILVYSQLQRQPHTPYSSRTKLAFISDPNPYFEDAGLFLQQGDYRRAIDTYELIRYSNDLEQSFYPILNRNLGYAYFQENRYGAAVGAYEDYLKRSKFQAQNPFRTEYAYASSGSSPLQYGMSDYMTYILLGKAYKNIGYINKARLTFEKAIEIEPKEADAYSNLALLYSKDYKQNYLLAETLGYTAIKLNPNNAEYQDSLGSVLIENGRLNKATDVLEYAVRLHSDYYPAHYHLSMISMDSKEPNHSLNIVKKNLVRKSRGLNQARSAMIGLLSYIYENKVREKNRLIPSLYRIRGLHRSIR
ncbi:HEAT repeat domain-containing protein [Candidatus Poribacteria bacterium]|nr:HEAT repeat domain-containing protein [Candidatus Poribacteria bacterium]